MKTQYLIQTVFACSLFLSCAEAPEYTPKPQQPVTSTSPNQTATKSDTADTQKTADNKDTSTVTPPATTTPAPTTPAPTPTPTPSAAPAPNPSLGVAATGKAALMQTCINANCHSAATNTIDAKTAAALQAAGNLQVPVHQANRATFFTPPAAGAAANNFAHVLAYLMSIPTPVMGPNLP